MFLAGPRTCCAVTFVGARPDDDGAEPATLDCRVYEDAPYVVMELPVVPALHPPSRPQVTVDRASRGCGARRTDWNPTFVSTGAIVEIDDIDEGTSQVGGREFDS